MSKNERPIGSRDWNNDGKYDFFDKMTDFYVYKKVTESDKDKKKDFKKNKGW